jgi:hypothetical protein
MTSRRRLLLLVPSNRQVTLAGLCVWQSDTAWIAIEIDTETQSMRNACIIPVRRRHDSLLEILRRSLRL